jgi:hypothetical protein
MPKRKKPPPIRPWKPSVATTRIRRKADDDPTIYPTGHAKAQMADRDLIMSDVLHVLKRGFVYEEAEPAKEDGFFRYHMEGPSPNSGGRSIRVVVIPFPTPALKIVTVMWVDEDMHSS